MDVVELLLKSPDVLEPFLEIRRRLESVLNDSDSLAESAPDDASKELFQLLRPTVADLTSDKSIRTRLEEGLATQSGQLLTKIVTRNKFARESQSLHLLFNVVVGQNRLPIEYSDLEPFLRVLRRYSKDDASETFAGVGYNMDGRDWAAGSIAAELVGLVAAMAKAGNGEQVAEVLRCLKDQFDVSPTLLLRIGAAKRLAGSPDTLLLWLKSIKSVEDEIEQFYGTDKNLPPHYFVDRLAEVAGELVQRDASAFKSLIKIAPSLVRGTHGIFYGMECIDNVAFAHRTGHLDAYFAVSQSLLACDSTTALDWFHVYGRFVDGGYSHDQLSTLIAENSENWLPYRHMFRPLKGDGRKLSRQFIESREIVESWWAAAGQIATQSNSAASFFLKSASAIYLRLGPEFFSKWKAEGEQLSALNPSVGAYFFLKSPLITALNRPPDQLWFGRLSDLASRTPSNAGWIGNALRLMKFDERRGSSFYDRHDQLFDKLSLICNGRKFASYDFETLQSAKEVDSHLKAWELLADNGKRQAISVKPRMSEVQPFLAGGVTISLVHNVFCHAFLVELFGERKDRRTESEHSNELVKRLAEPDVQAELEVLRSLPCENEFRSLEQVEHFGDRLRLGDLLGSVHTLDVTGFDSSWFLERLRPAIFRQTKPRIPLLKDIFQELDRFPNIQEVTEKLLLWTPSEDSLEDVIAGNENTLSCTDGPTGQYRRASIIHAVQRDSGTLLCSLVQDESSPLPYTTFASVPFFLAHDEQGQQMLFVDSIEVGSIVHMIDNGVELVASRLAMCLSEMARSKGLTLFVSDRFFNVRGRALLSQIQQQLGMSPAETRIEVRSDDLAENGVRWFYFESKRSDGRPWTRTTTRQRYLAVSGFQCFPAQLATAYR